uniref:G-protein coupled receptors family 1 profile domain-containing protein n=1 Tax=Panagrolaimus sp. PS1159 TaxID=55785 RepID=A0AC35FQ89_9BILA
MRTDCSMLEYPYDNITHYVAVTLGDRCVPDTFVIPTVFIYGLILVLGVLGNLGTCVVIIKNKNMQTPTNCYLFSLAISDLLMLILGLPGELYGMFVPQYPYEFGETTCKLRAFLIEFTSYASILTITCFSIERWLAICFPLRIHLFSTVKRASKVIICVWICAFLTALPVVFLVLVNKVPLPDWAKGLPGISNDGETIINTEYCGLDSTRSIEQKRLFYTSFTFFFLLPALLISFVYCHIVIKLRSANDYLSSQNAQTKSAAKSRKGILRILVAVVITFFLCWFPFHVQRLMTHY